jgi:uncharacterized membrane protein (DUF4010 family)
MIQSHEMDRFEPLLSLGLAIAIGLLIGFEREQAAPDDPEERRRTFVGGARTYPLVAFVGALAALLMPVFGVGIVLVAFAALASFIGVAYYAQTRAHGDRGLTSETAFLATFLLGTLTTAPGLIEPLSRRAVLLASAAVVVTLILSIKPRLHALAERATTDDVYATLKFLIVGVVVLPLLPNETFGPLDVLNPFKIGLMVVLIAGIDFVGYVAFRVVGPGRGLALTGIVGGLASSTAVTLSMSQRAKSTPDLAPSCALAVVTASTIMVPRVLLEVSVVNRGLIDDLLFPLGGMMLGGVIAAIRLYLRTRDVSAKSTGIQIQNPFELSSALKWGLIFTVVLFAARFASDLLGSRGSYVAGVLAGATDVDAITLSMASLAKGGSVEARVAVTTIMLGTASNTVVKGVMATVIGGVAFGKHVILAYGLSLAGALIGLGVLWLR